MAGLLSLPPELLYQIIETCSERGRCRLRTTCKLLHEHADPIIFRRLRLYFRGESAIIEHQIIALATRSSNACEFTRDLEILRIPNGIRSSELSWPQIGHCDDLRIHLPTAISTLQNVTRFSWIISDYDPQWLIDSLMQTIARLPHLTELSVETWNGITARIPLGLFANLSKLSVDCSPDDVSFFISEMSTVIANSPQLKSLHVFFMRNSTTLPTLFSETSTENPLYLEDLSIGYMDATVDQAVLPHLTHLTSFKFRDRDISVARSVWTSFLVNDIKLSTLDIAGNITEETMIYLSSFSGLERLAIGHAYALPGRIMDNLNTLLKAVIPKHVNSLQTLVMIDNPWVFDYDSLKLIMKCLNLRDLSVAIDGKDSGMPVQLLLDTVAHLPELRTLCIRTRTMSDGLQISNRPKDCDMLKS